MNDNHIEIKEQRKDWLLKGILSLILMLAAIFITLLPLLSTFAMSRSVYFYSIGGIAFVASTSVFVYLLYKECNPDIYMVLNAHGFIDRKNVGDDIEIEWTNVASVKVLGKIDTPFLGITLENNDIVIARMRKNKAEEMTENVNENLPAILIAQNEIRIPLKDLKETLTKFVREARALEKDIPKKPKSNPFSTDDVLRAFGKLPKEDDEHEENAESTEATENILGITESPEDNNDIPTAKTEETEEPKTEDKTHEHEEYTSSLFYTGAPSKESESETNLDPQDDPFYAALQKITTENIGSTDTTKNVDIDDNNTSYTNDSTQDEDIPEEIKAILSKAKSSKIDELGKMLNETDKPFTYSPESKITSAPIDAECKTESDEEIEKDYSGECKVPDFLDIANTSKNNDASTENAAESPENVNYESNKDALVADSNDVNENENKHNANSDTEIPIENTTDTATEGKADDCKNKELPFEMTLDSMIENALKSECDNNTDEILVPHLEVPKIETPVFVEPPEIDENESQKPKNKKKVTFVLHEKKK